jgi:kynurenine formamidase
MIMAEHSGTHIDALCHQAENMRLYGGQEAVAPVQGPRGFSVLAAEHIPLLFSRGVLLDVAAARGVELIPPGELIDRQELAETADRHGVDLMPGDVVLVRTGTGALWDNPDEYLEGAGMGVDASRWLARQSPVAVGSDNVAWDSPKVSDPELGSLPGHVLLIVRGGIYIIENLFLEELAREEIREFMLLCVPLKMRGVTASPVRPLAIAPQGDDERSG